MERIGSQAALYTVQFRLLASSVAPDFGFVWWPLALVF